MGGGQGLLTAVRTKPELGVDTTRLRINRVLNLSGKTGRSAGNALGCLGLFYASSESGLDYLNDGRLPDLFASLGAGAISHPRTPPSIKIGKRWKGVGLLGLGRGRCISASLWV